MRVETYNTRGLPKQGGDLYLRPDIIQIFEANDIVCLQETWYATQDLKHLNNLHHSFYGFGCATVNYDSNIICGHPPGGVAIFWRRNIAANIKLIDTNVGWCTGIEISCGAKRLPILNVYMPYQCDRNYDEYLEKLGTLGAIVSELDHTCFCILGDWNANPSDINNSLFGVLLHNFTQELDLLISSALLLPSDSYTYVSAAWDSVSWLDHIISSADFHDSISSIVIEYDCTDEDHIPVFLTLDLNCIPDSAESRNDVHNQNISWDRLTNEEVLRYTKNTDDLLRSLTAPVGVFSCQNVNCSNDLHTQELSKFYDKVFDVLVNCGEEIVSHSRNKNYVARPGWSDYVSELYDLSRELRKQWLVSGKPRFGSLHERYVKSKARFKYALRYIKRNESALRQESLARKMMNFDKEDFWKEIRVMNNSHTPLPLNVEGINGAENIAAMWKNHFQDLFNCIQRYDLSDIDCNNTNVSDVVVCENEITSAIKSLSLGKSCGMDGIYAEHLKYCSDLIVPILSKCFSSFFVHGFLPSRLLSVVLVPIVKDKTAKITSKDNYRPIALASVVSKVLEKIILFRIEDYISTQCNQFGFKAKHGTDQCIYVLKEVVESYRTLNGTIFACFLDASKAFDRVNHNTLFKKLLDRGVPPYIVRLLVFWYVHQTICVRWGGVSSETFTVTNGVRQGGILSPLLFNLYMDGLSSLLNNCNIGCCVGNTTINNLMYADDLVVFSPSAAGLRKLLNICENFASASDIKYNERKSAVLIFRPKGEKAEPQPKFYLNGSLMAVVKTVKYLGQYLTNDLTDNHDIKRQCAKLYIQGNTILRKFYMCTVDVKLTLFRSFCMPMYGAHLWWNYTKSTINRLYISYHNIFKMFLGFSKFESTSLLCTVFNMQSCAAVIRNLIYKFMIRLEKSTNSLITCVMNSSLLFTSHIRKHWYALLYVHFNCV